MLRLMKLKRGVFLRRLIPVIGFCAIILAAGAAVRAAGLGGGAISVALELVLGIGFAVFTVREALESLGRELDMAEGEWTAMLPVSGAQIVFARWFGLILKVLVFAVLFGGSYILYLFITKGTLRPAFLPAGFRKAAVPLVLAWGLQAIYAFATLFFAQTLRRMFVKIAGGEGSFGRIRVRIADAVVFAVLYAAGAYIAYSLTVLLPRGIDLSAWALRACPEYARLSAYLFLPWATDFYRTAAANPTLILVAPAGFLLAATVLQCFAAAYLWDNRIDRS